LLCEWNKHVALGGMRDMEQWVQVITALIGAAAVIAAAYIANRARPGNRRKTM
jgi:hypothetical protein